VSFDGTTPAIRSRRGSLAVRSAIPDHASKAAEYQAELDAFLLGCEGRKYEFSDPDFPFRYASGGTLPIVGFENEEYYCFFYREVHPIGWNIANGGCDSLIELLNPLYTVERELREELLIIDGKREHLYVFDWLGDKVHQP
jgi:hypothetical protein